MQSAYAPSKPENQEHPKSWRGVLPVHPAADLFPLMGKDELRELADDIAKHGLREKVDLYFDRDGKCFLLDGRNRVAALVLLGKELFDDKDRFRQEFHSCPPPKVYSEADCIAYVISKNIHRRHLTAEQKRDLIGKLLKANPEKSNRQIATELGRSHVTVGAVREELESTGQIDQLKKTKGKDGKSRPAKKNQTTEKVAGSINGSRPIPEVEAKPSKSNHHLKVLTSGLRNVLAQSWGELAAQIASNNQTMLKAALKNHLSVVKQTCQQLGVTHDYN